MCKVGAIGHVSFKEINTIYKETKDFVWGQEDKYLKTFQELIRSYSLKAQECRNVSFPFEKKSPRDHCL